MPKRQTGSLSRYRAKRSPSATPEPMGRLRIPSTGKLFVIQQHHASHLHFDLRLEHAGVLKSWAVPKGPSLDPSDKRFAALVEDHPLDYADFEGQIPEGNYGAGHVIVWDRGHFDLIGDFEAGLEKGKLLFNLQGHKLRGRWTLVRMRSRDAPKNDTEGRDWLFIKEHDQYTSEDAELADTSVLSGLTVDELAEPAVVRRKLLNRAKRLTAGRAYDRKQPPAPMLASTSEPFDRANWLFEFKYDGYRLIGEKREDNNGDVIVTLHSRNGHDLTLFFPEIAQVLHHLPVKQVVIDGEAVVHDDSGRPSFSLLQERMAADSELHISMLTITRPATLWAFDLISVEQFDTRELKLRERKQMLERVLPDRSAIRYSAHVARAGNATFRQAVNLGLEGIVGKDADAPYKSGRSDAWRKMRNQRTDDYVIVGTRASKSNARDIGALALGEYRQNELTYVGNVGSGLSGRVRAQLEVELAKVGAGDALVERADIAWLHPKLVCEVAFKEYTSAGHLRQPVFMRLRTDKPPNECTGRYHAPQTRTLAKAPEQPVVVTNADKTFYPEKSLTKQHLVDYYERIAPWMLPYLDDRPIVLTRFPDGIHGKSFYQRDAPDFVPDWLERTTLYSESADREVNYFIVRTASALKYLANMATIPIHMWHARLGSLDRPDWCVLDLDPKKAPFKHVIKLALAIRDLCEELAVPCFPKTSGASGLHVLIPLNRQLSHEQSRSLGELLARVIVARHPEIATVARNVASRHNRVYVDYLQNGHGRLIVAPFSARAEPAASVSMPLRWQEVKSGLANERYHLKNAVTRMKRLEEDPMRGLLTQDTDLVFGLARLAEIYDES